MDVANNATGDWKAIAEEQNKTLLLCKKDYEGIKRGVEKIHKVKNIHHVHSWMINEKTIYFEAHVEMEDMPFIS